MANPAVSAYSPSHSSPLTGLAYAIIPSLLLWGIIAAALIWMA